MSSPHSPAEQLREDVARIMTTNWLAIPEAERPPEGTADWHINSILDAIATALQNGIRLPEKNNRPHKMFDGGYTAEVTAYADGYDAGIDAAQSAIDGFVGQIRGEQ